MNGYEIAEITQSGLAELNKCVSFWDYTESMAEIIKNGERKAFAYKVNGEYLGGCMLCHRETHGHFSHFAVKSELRGNGIGGRIIDFAVDYFKNAGMKRIRLHVYTDNPRAIKLYERKGFTYLENVTPEKIAMIKEL